MGVGRNRDGSPSEPRESEETTDPSPVSRLTGNRAELTVHLLKLLVANREDWEGKKSEAATVSFVLEYNELRHVNSLSLKSTNTPQT